MGFILAQFSRAGRLVNGISLALLDIERLYVLLHYSADFNNKL